MPKYSRTKKYEDLRNSLQNDAESSIQSRELSAYANRLNRIDSSNFESMNDSNIEHDPIHQRREVTFNSDYSSSPIRSEIMDRPVNDEYMKDIYKEVKQYNLDNGTLISDNTQQNILRELKGERPSATNNIRSYEETAKIPSFTQKPRIMSAPDTKQLSADDIALRDKITSEMAAIMKNEPDYSYLNESDDDSENTATKSYSVLEDTLAFEKVEREKLTKENSQMKAKMDEYEDSLTDINEKTSKNSRILNFILVILIFAVLIVFGIVVYMLLLNKGII